MDVTVEIDPDGTVRGTISDENGYSPDIVDDLARASTDVRCYTTGCVDDDGNPPVWPRHLWVELLQATGTGR